LGPTAGTAVVGDFDCIAVAFSPYLVAYYSAALPADDDRSSCRLENGLKPIAFRLKLEQRVADTVQSARTSRLSRISASGL
jgi:hypothetical protein